MQVLREQMDPVCLAEEAESVVVAEGLEEPAAPLEEEAAGLPMREAQVAEARLA